RVAGGEAARGADLRERCSVELDVVPRGGEVVQYIRVRRAEFVKREAVLPRAATDGVVARATFDPVSAIVAADGIVPRATQDTIVAVAAEERVIAAEALDEIAACGAVDGVRE